MNSDERRVAAVRETMTTHVIVATPDDRLIDAARAMREGRVSGLPVVTSDRTVVGIVSERDIVAELHRAAGLLSFRGILDMLLAFSGEADVERIRQSVERLHSARVREVMSKKPVVADPSDSVQECLRLMLQYSVNRLPVVENGRLVGLITRGDVIRWLGSPPASPPSPSQEPRKRSHRRSPKSRPRPRSAKESRRRERLEDVR